MEADLNDDELPMRDLSPREKVDLLLNEVPRDELYAHLLKSPVFRKIATQFVTDPSMSKQFEFGGELSEDEG